MQHGGVLRRELAAWLSDVDRLLQDGRALARWSIWLHLDAHLRDRPRKLAMFLMMNLIWSVYAGVWRENEQDEFFSQVGSGPKLSIAGFRKTKIQAAARRSMSTRMASLGPRRSVPLR